VDQLSRNFEAKDTAWCGMTNLLKGGLCVLHLSPFGSNFVGIAKPTFRQKGCSSCGVRSELQPNYLMVASLVLGLIMFIFADRLSKSTGFRVSSAGLVFGLGSVVILMYMLMRLVPNRQAGTPQTCLEPARCHSLTHNFSNCLGGVLGTWNSLNP
jgi:hypothetical protein